ncbi:hypothetical protein Tco_0342046, partial [Tanacetum coccineum]
FSFSVFFNSHCHKFIEFNKEVFFERSSGTDNQEKDEKQSQNDKTGLGMEKTVKDKAKKKRGKEKTRAQFANRAK